MVVALICVGLNCTGLALKLRGFGCPAWKNFGGTNETKRNQMRSLVAVLLCSASILAYPRYGQYDAVDREIKEKLVAEIVSETLQKKSKSQKEDFEVQGFGCDLCVSTIYSINHNIAQMKASAEDMVKKDCEALFGGDNEAVATCISLMIDKIEEYYEKIEPMIDTKRLCVKIGMCVRKEDEDPITTSTIKPATNPPKTSSSSSSSASSEKSSSSKSSEEKSVVKKLIITPETAQINSIIEKVEKVFSGLF